MIMAEHVISPDGKLFWDGDEWIPIPLESQNVKILDSVVTGDIEVTINSLDDIGAAVLDAVEELPPRVNFQKISYKDSEDDECTYKDSEDDEWITGNDEKEFVPSGSSIHHLRFIFPSSDWATEEAAELPSKFSAMRDAEIVSGVRKILSSEYPPDSSRYCHDRKSNIYGKIGDEILEYWRDLLHGSFSGLEIPMSIVVRMGKLKEIICAEEDEGFSERICMERKNIPNVVFDCVLWAKSVGLRKMTHADMKAYYSNNDIFLIGEWDVPQTIYKMVNEELRMY
jgi:hypothetical protein